MIGLFDCIHALVSWKLSRMMMVRWLVVICTTGSVVLLLTWVLMTVGQSWESIWFASVLKLSSCLSAASVQCVSCLVFSNWIGVGIFFSFGVIGVFVFLVVCCFLCSIFG